MGRGELRHHRVDVEPALAGVAAGHHAAVGRYEDELDAAADVERRDEFLEVVEADVDAHQALEVAVAQQRQAVAGREHLVVVDAFEVFVVGFGYHFAAVLAIVLIHSVGLAVEVEGVFAHHVGGALADDGGAGAAIGVRPMRVEGAELPVVPHAHESGIVLLGGGHHAVAGVDALAGGQVRRGRHHLLQSAAVDHVDRQLVGEAAGYATGQGRRLFLRQFQGLVIVHKRLVGDDRHVDHHNWYEDLPDNFDLQVVSCFHKCF